MTTSSLSRDDAIDVIGRLRHVLGHVQLDCKCQDNVFGALDRFVLLEERRFQRRQLAEARDCRERIAAMVMRLAELDEISESEPDRTVFKELELLFSAVSDDAAEAAGALRRISDRLSAQCSGDRGGRDDRATVQSLLPRKEGPD